MESLPPCVKGVAWFGGSTVIRSPPFKNSWYRFGYRLSGEESRLATFIASQILHGSVTLCCSKIAEAEAGVSVNEKKWLVMHVHVQMRCHTLLAKSAGQAPKALDNHIHNQIHLSTQQTTTTTAKNHNYNSKVPKLCYCSAVLPSSLYSLPYLPRR